MGFKKDFIWGAASSSYQIEGAWNKDGKGLSSWDVFSHQSGTIKGGFTGDIACNHYYDYKKDVAIMKEMGLKAYRFSVSWPRIFPKGDMTLNEKGLAFYDNLVDELLANHIEPYMTLYHWDLPQTLSEAGGWLNRDIADSFAEYAGFMVAHFSDRITNYFTLNEPQCTSFLGYATGDHAPGLKLSDAQILKTFHYQALAHGKAVTAMRKKAIRPIKIGFASTGCICFPQEETKEDIELARTLTYTFPKEGWGFTHQIFADPVLLGKYARLPDFLSDADLSFQLPQDLDIIHQQTDFFGVNVYNGHEVSSKIEGGFIPKYEGFPRTAVRWPVTEGVMNYGMRFIAERYQVPLIISENGQSCNDRIFLDGRVHDPDRIDFTARYLMELEKAIDAGVDIQGYFHWSLTDNFEWSNGYDEHFGLVFVDYPTQRRILKDSAYWYRDFIKAHS